MRTSDPRERICAEAVGAASARKIKTQSDYRHEPRRIALNHISATDVSLQSVAGIHRFFYIVKQSKCDFFVNSQNYGCLKVFLDAYQVREEFQGEHF